LDSTPNEGIYANAVCFRLGAIEIREIRKGKKGREEQANSILLFSFFITPTARAKARAHYSAYREVFLDSRTAEYI
jgi:hypothetical protein